MGNNAQWNSILYLLFIHLKLTTLRDRKKLLGNSMGRVRTSSNYITNLILEMDFSK
jgi:hypothetical protein